MIALLSILFNNNDFAFTFLYIFTHFLYQRKRLILFRQTFLFLFHNFFILFLANIPSIHFNQLKRIFINIYKFNKNTCFLNCKRDQTLYLISSFALHCLF